MPKISRVELTSDQRREVRVRERLRARDLAPGTRLRLECIRLLGRGLTVPEVADLLECNEVTVRGAVHRFAAGGFGALADAPRPGRPASVTREDREVAAAPLDESARQGRTWTAAALCDWLAAERGVRVSAAQLTELLHRDGLDGFRWKRTRDTLRHKAAPVLQQAARAQLEDLRLCSWTRTRTRGTCASSTGAVSPRPCPGIHLVTGRAAGRRATRGQEGPARERPRSPGRGSAWRPGVGEVPAARSTRSCCWSSCARSWPGCQVVLSHRTGPSGLHPGPPCTVVLDNASAHVARVFKGRREELAASASDSSTSRPAAPS
ncbi:helix-turn-helix domain-containing protein [Streptomyces sp. NBC_00853]|uniref:helix-turn-helix domain-containing protein n=1 Tax=Streptomyces sp. NBC_00853 TaxID=2903681 RepID=UPI003873C5BA